MSRKNNEMKGRNREQKREDFKKTVTKIVVNGEKALYKGKKLMIVVVIPLLEVLANLLSLMEDDDYNNGGRWD